MSSNAVGKYFRGKRVLITGAAGHVGQALAQVLLATQCTVLRASRQPPWAASFERDISLHVTDYADPAFWQQTLVGTDVVYHLAAQTSLEEASRDPRADWHANVEPMLTLLETCRAQQIRPVIVFAGSSTQAGLVTQLPVSEAVEDAPVSIYDAHKLAAENYLKTYCRLNLVRGVTLRLTNVYGPGRSGNPQRGVLNRMVRQALRGEKLTIYGPGEWVRDYVYIDDVATALALAATAIEPLNGLHCLLGSGQGHTIADAFHLVAELVAEMTGAPAVPVEHVPVPAGLAPIETRNFVADITRLRTACAWTPAVGLREGLRRTVESERV